MNIFEQQVEDKKLHPNYRSLFVERNRYALDVLLDWSTGFEDRDGKFVKEFQTTFNSSFWELYIFAVLKKLGFSVSFDFNAPDFNVVSPQHFCIEATTTSNSIGVVAEHTQTLLADIPEDLNESIGLQQFG